jgi:penicillin amidase
VGARLRRPLGGLVALTLVAVLAPALAAGAGAPPRSPEVTIRRDTWGVPHVYARDTYGLFYGYGYAVAQDRLFEMEMARRSATGTVAEVLGPAYADFDVSIRTNFTPASIRGQIDRLPAQDRAILDGYAAGFSSRVAQVLARPATLLPKQFLDFGFRPVRWTAFDVAMVFVGSMANRFSDLTGELPNLALRQALVDQHGARAGRQLFDQLRWLQDPTAPTTVPGPRAGMPTVAGGAQDRLGRLPARVRADAVARAAAPAPQTSNAWLVGKDRAQGAQAIFVNGPQFSWFVPAYVYSIGLHGAGFDLVGNTPFGYPAVLFGHNRHITWGSTAGLGNSVDVYEERLNPADPRQYRFRGRWLTMTSRTDRIKVKGAADRTVEVLGTVHGLVLALDPASGVAYSKRRAWDGLEVESLMGWTRQAQASNPQEWLRQAERQKLTINWYYADRRGTIGYVHTGRYPIRAPGHDVRVPAIGTGSMEWQGFQPFERNPQVFNPRTGYLANWNNKPAPGYPNNDTIFWGRADRVDVLHRQLAGTGRLSADEMWRINEIASFADLNLPYLLPFVERATAGLPAGDPARLAARLLRGWNQQNADRNRDGRYDSAATALMYAWLPLLLSAVLADDVPTAFQPAFLASGYPTREAPLRGSQNIQSGTKVVVNALLGPRAGVSQRYDLFNGASPPAVIRATLRSAVRQLQAGFGPAPASWRQPVSPLLLETKNFWGVPQANPDEEIRTAVAMNRGTENDRIVLSTYEVRGAEVTPPGQSGFVAPDGTRARHYRDQLPLFVDFRLKPMWLYPLDVRRHTESVTRLP